MIVEENLLFGMFWEEALEEAVEENCFFCMFWEEAVVEE
jgi:hypothetical protein